MKNKVLKIGGAFFILLFVATCLGGDNGEGLGLLVYGGLTAAVYRTVLSGIDVSIGSD